MKAALGGVVCQGVVMGFIEADSMVVVECGNIYQGVIVGSIEVDPADKCVHRQILDGHAAS